MKKYLSLLALIFGLSIGFVSPSEAVGVNDHQLTICHATGNPGHYSTPNPTKQQIFDDNGHNSGGGVHPGDIIPPFTAGEHGGLEWGDFAGQNWDVEGQAIFENGCVVPEVVTTTTTPPTTAPPTTTPPTTVLTPTTVPVVTTVPCHEGDPCWDCNVMGNLVCGPTEIGTALVIERPAEVAGVTISRPVVTDVALARTGGIKDSLPIVALGLSMSGVGLVILSEQMRRKRQA